MKKQQHFSWPLCINNAQWYTDPTFSKFKAIFNKSKLEDFMEIQEKGGHNVTTEQS